MTLARGRKIALFAGLGTALVIVVGGVFLRHQLRFLWYFEPIGRDDEGQVQYRHRSLGVVLVRRPRGFSVRFSGRVTAGEDFSRKISKRLAFRLCSLRDGSGWSAWVGYPENERDDFSFPVTPPFRWGANARVIEARHFRNSDNSGPNGPGEKNVNAPGERRDFLFVLDERGYTVASALLDGLLWPGSEAEWKETIDRYHGLKVGAGTLEITSMTMSNLGVGLKPRIDAMTFEVDLRFPRHRLEAMFY